MVPSTQCTQPHVTPTQSLGRGGHLGPFRPAGGGAELRAAGRTPARGCGTGAEHGSGGVNWGYETCRHDRQAC